MASPSWLAAVFEEEELGGSVGKEEADGAVAASEIAQDAATGTRAVDLVNADVGPHVELAPGFDEAGAFRLVGQKRFQGRSRVFNKGHGGGLFDRGIIEARRFFDAGGWQFGPP